MANDPTKIEAFRAMQKLHIKKTKLSGNQPSYRGYLPGPLEPQI